MTRQVSDILIFEGEKYPLLSSIYLPENDTRVAKLTDEEYKALFDDGDEERKENLRKVNEEIQAKINSHEKLTGEARYVLSDEESERLEKYTYRSSAYYTSSTACWRRYIATWEVKDGVLYLSSIVGRYNLLSDEPIIADWYSSTVKVGVGKVLDSNMVMAAGDIYEKENHIVIENGRVISTTFIDRNEEDGLLYSEVNRRTKDRSKHLRQFLNLDDEL